MDRLRIPLSLVCPWKRDLLTVLSLFALAGPGVAKSSNEIVRLNCAHPTITLPLQVVNVDEQATAVKVVIDVEGHSSSVLFGEERGTDVEWRLEGSNDFRPADSRPGRYGLFSATVRNSTAVSVRAVRGVSRSAVVALTLACSPDAETAALPACLGALNAPDTPDEGRWCAALKQHAAAYVAGKVGDSAGALEHYRRAAEAWQARGDGVREGAALLGATESLVRLGRLREAVAEAKRSAAVSSAADSPYFALRARSESCLSLRDLGSRAEARHCLEPLPAAFLALGETADAANVYYSVGSMANEDGDWREAEMWLDRSRTIDVRAAYPEITGRLNVLAAWIDARRGQLSAAMADLDTAATIFEKTGNARWRANVDLILAHLYAQMGSWSESGLFAEAALSALPEGQADRRRAAAQRALGHAQLALGAVDKARVAFSEARRLLGDDAPLATLELDLDAALMLGDAESLARAAASDAVTPAAERLKARLRLAQARQAWEDGQYGAASKIASAIHVERLELADYLAFRGLQVALLGQAYKSAEAFALLDGEISQLRARASSASAAGLRHMLGQRLLDLRRFGIDLYLSLDAADRPEPAWLWTLVQRTQAESLMSAVGTDFTSAGSQAEAVDRALGEVLIGSRPEIDNTAPQRALVRYYAELKTPAGPHISTTTTEPTGGISLAEVRASMPLNTVFLALAFGTTRGVVIAATRDEVWVVPTGSLEDVRVAAAALREGVSNRDSPTDRIASAASRLSVLLLGELPASLPNRLRVVSDAAVSGVPWSLLTWPGQKEWLIDTTAVSLLPAGLTIAHRAPRTLPERIDALIDDGGGGSSRALSRLTYSGREAGWIAAALHQTPSFVALMDIHPSARSSFSERLRSQGSWIHVAAHGTTVSSLQSYSGVWTSGEQPDGNPQFISWLDLAEKQAHADLVVLDACSLAADEPRATAGAVTFATALSSAGVRDVVAALWPLSDAAASQWVPAFYGALYADPDLDVAEAVRAAQLALRTSRAHRHPFYWASLVHLAH